MSENLSQAFQKSPRLEDVLKRINESLLAVDLFGEREPSLPVLLIMGCPRSGTTLFLQWLAASGCFAYPSNLVARFYGNPGFGSEVQKALVDYDPSNQLGLATPDNYDSTLGRTHGALAPSEFWYFWRRYFQFRDEHRLDSAELASVDTSAFLKDLAGMEASQGKPLAMKGMILNWHIPFLSSLSERIFLVKLERAAEQVAESILHSREVYGGDRETWWSFKPPGYREWLDLDPLEQVAAQVSYTQEAVNAGMRQISHSRKLEIRYPSFCENPRETWDQLRHCYASMGHSLPGYSGQPVFRQRTESRLSEKEQARLKELLTRYGQEAQQSLSDGSGS